LIELAQAVTVCAVDDDRIRQRDIEAVLDDRGRDEHVVLVVHEGEHHAFELRFRQLTVPYNDARLRH
jgi:hypothetical protein